MNAVGKARGAIVGGCVLAAVLLAGGMFGRLNRVSGVDDAVELPPGADPTTTHMEYQNHPWMPNTGEIPEGVVSVVGPIVRGRFTSIQVNVNAVGTNIPGDAANEPSIAVDPNDHDRMAIAWRQFDTIASDFRQAGYAYTQDGGASWTFPGSLDAGQFRSDPVMAVDATGRFYLSSLSSLTSVEVFQSTDGGANWTAPLPAFGGDKQWMVADATQSGGSGHLYQIWNVQFSCCSGRDFTRSINGGLTFLGPYAIPTPSMKWGTMDVTLDGTLYLAGSTLSQSGHLFARSSNVDQAGQTPVFDFVMSVALGGTTTFGASTPNPGGLLGQVWLSVDRTTTGPTTGNIYIAASVDPVGTDPQDFMFIRSTNGGQSWSAPQRVNDDATSTNAWQWFGTMSVAPNGRIDMIWNDTRNTGEARRSELHYSSSVDGGQTWTPNEPVTPIFDSYLGWPQQNKLGDYYHMISDLTGADLAYAATFNGEQDVYYVRLTPDCNGNTVADADDIANATSTDCNSNFIPDDCEMTEDCDDNGIPDICDIAAAGGADCNHNQRPDVCDIADGTSLDENGDGVPDECECALAVTAPLPEPNAMTKNRYLSFVPGNAGKQAAVRVTFTAMPAAYADLVGTSRWVDAPVAVSENAGTLDPADAPAFPSFLLSSLSCDPVYRDWGGDGVIHVAHPAIVPNGQYRIEIIEAGCSVDVAGNYSDAYFIASAVWGDTVKDCTSSPCGGPNGVIEVTDVLAILDKFANRVGAITKARADLIPSTPDRVIDINDAVFALDAFTGDAYSLSGPSACP